MSALVDLLEDCRPADLDRVIPIVQRLHAWLGEAAYEGCDKPGFAGRTLALAQDARFDADARLALLGDVLDLTEACGLPIAEADYGRLGVLARVALGEATGHIRHRGEAADRRVARRHTVLPGALVAEGHGPTRDLVAYVAALAGDASNELVDVWVRGEVSPELAQYIAERLGPALERVRLFAIDRQPDYLALLMQQGPRTTHVFRENPMSPDISLLALLGPTLMVVGQDVPPLQHADVYWSCREPTDVEARWRRCGAPEAFVANYVATQAVPRHGAPAVRPRGREELGLSQEDLVVATAGARLGVEFDQAFVDGIGGFLLADPRRRWLVAGELPDFWMSAFGQVLGRQFVHLPLENDLPGLLAAADLVANPFRTGGGDIALAAVEAGAVVLTCDLGDVAGFVPAAHRAGSPESYFERLDELAADASLRQAWAAEQRALASRRLDQPRFAAELKDLIALAYKRYRARLPASLEEILALRPPGVGSLRGRA